jgi:hypothetical protein
MSVLNLHECILETQISKAGELIDRLASENDVLWPVKKWSPMKFDKPLCVGASGGHGSIGYEVEEYQPGRYIKFRFTRPKGYNGYHWFEIGEVDEGKVRLRHVIEMEVSGVARFTWPLMIRPLHDALLEDAFDCARTFTGNPPVNPRWPMKVRIIRWLIQRLRTQRK